MKHLLILLLLLVVKITSAQENKTLTFHIKKPRVLITEAEPAIMPEPLKLETYQDMVFIEVLNQASFPGGQDSLIKFIKQNLKYPKACVDEGIKGTIYVRFVLENNGSINSVQAINPINSLLAEEAIRVVKLMPPWIPATSGTNNVTTTILLPIIFKI